MPANVAGKLFFFAAGGQQFPRLLHIDNIDLDELSVVGFGGRRDIGHDELFEIRD